MCRKRKIRKWKFKKETKINIKCANKTKYNNCKKYIGRKEPYIVFLFVFTLSFVFEIILEK